MKHKATANEEYVWNVKNKKQEQVSDPDPVKAMTEFGHKYGTRGEIRVTRWQRTHGDMLTSTGVNFKGTFKEVVEKLKQHVSMATSAATSDSYKITPADLKVLRKLAAATNLDWKSLAARPYAARKMLDEYRECGTVNGHKVTANGGSFKPNWTPTETKLVSILKELDPLHGIEVKELREKLAGKAWEDLKKIPKPVDQAIESLIAAGYMHKIRRGKQWWVKPDKIVTEATAASKTVQETAESLLKKHRKSYSPEIDVDETTKAIEHALSIVKDLFKGDTISRIDAPMALRASSVLMRKGNKQQSTLGHDVFVKASNPGQATADFDVDAAKPDDKEVPKPSGSNLLGNTIIGDIKRIQSSMKTWKSKKGPGAPDPEQLKEYLAYMKDVAGYIVKTYLPKVPDNYKAKIKAI